MVCLCPSLPLTKLNTAGRIIVLQHPHEARHETGGSAARWCTGTETRPPCPALHARAWEDRPAQELTRAPARCAPHRRKPLGTVAVLELCLADLTVLRARKYKVRDAGVASQPQPALGVAGGAEARVQEGRVGALVLRRLLASPRSFM